MKEGLLKKAADHSDHNINLGRNRKIEASTYR